LKVLFVLHYPNPFPGASWTRISFFAKFLKDKGHEVSINGAFSLKALNRFGILHWKGLKLYNITPIILLNNIFSLIFNICSSVFTTFLMIILTRPDIIVISVPIGDTALGSCFAAFVSRKKVVIDYRDEWEDNKINNAKSEIYRKLCKSLKKRMTKYYMQCNHVITVTAPIVDTLSNRGIKNVKLITNGADIKIFKPYDKLKLRHELGYDENDIIFVYSGGIVEYYRLDLVVSSFEELIKNKKNVRLLIVGRGIYLNALLALINKKGLQKNILYLGEVLEKIDLAKILSVSDVGLIPFDLNPLWKSALPSKALEYLACGLPILGTVHTDSLLGKLITENQIGFISEPENVNALIISLEKICNDKHLEKMGKNGCDLIRKKFDRNKISQDFLKLLEE